MSRKITLTGAIFILIAIILGAMAAHGLEQKISPKFITVFEKGVKYQMYMGLAFVAIGLNADKFNFSLTWFFRLVLIGVLLFSGCIYLYALHEMVPALKPAAMIVPFGGTAMIAGWVMLIIQFIRSR